MKKRYSLLVSILICSFSLLHAAVGDTTWVQAFHGNFTQYGAYDSAVNFPDGTVTYRKIYMIITIGEYACPSGSQYCHQWDYDVENYVMTPAGDTLELSRFITPYATAGTPGFTSTWQQHYIFDVTDYYKILKNAANIRTFYSGYSWGFTGDVKFAFIEGTPERNILGYDKLWNNGYSYGDPNNPISSNILPYTLTPPAGTQSAEMKFAITGHGYDNTSGCCEFDVTGVGHAYAVLANNNPVAQYNMNVNCGMGELYPQGGTWLSARAGNWCPGGSVQVGQYPLTGVTAGTPYTTNVTFDDSYDGGGAYGSYKIASAVFYYGGYNKRVDASLEDIIAPTNFEWYRRENPRASVPVIKVRNAGSKAITTMLIAYGVKDSTQTEYIWTGSLAPSADTTISLPALKSLTNLSFDSALAAYHFIADIVQVNGQKDDDQSNDTLTSTFKVAPKWPVRFSINLQTSSFGDDGNFNTNPSDASWQITDEHNNIVAQRTNTDVVTTYKDTLTLPESGFYTLTVTTTQCYGLNWWALEQPAPNNTVGYTPGSIYIWDVVRHIKIPVSGNTYTGTYHDDFGCGFVQYFTTQGQCQAAVPDITKAGRVLTASQGSAYKWYRNGDPIQGATNQTYTLVNATGNYTADVTNVFGCSATSASFAVSDSSITGVTDLSAYAASVSVFPNPAREVVNLEVDAELTGNTYIIYDMTGRRMLSGKIENELTAIPVNTIAGGIYLVTISDGTSSLTKRLVIQK